MARGDNRRTPKSRRRKSQRKLKARIKARISPLRRGATEEKKAAKQG